MVRLGKGSLEMLRKLLKAAKLAGLTAANVLKLDAQAAELVGQAQDVTRENSVNRHNPSLKTGRSIGVPCLGSSRQP